ncbi:MAG: hypothetical protein ACOZCE_09670 [Spirochaetota bacterium]
MSECEFIESCPFFNGKLANKPADIEKLKADYCKTNNLHCARYIIAQSLGKEYMPPDLYPHEKERAFELLAK